MAAQIFTDADLLRIREANPELFADPTPRTTVATLPADLTAHLPGTTVPARVYAADTPAHVDTDRTNPRAPATDAHVVYLTPSPGELFIGDETAYSLETPGRLYTIPAGIPHGTRGTDGAIRISLGPFNDAGRPVGIPTGTVNYYDTSQTSVIYTDFPALENPYTVLSNVEIGVESPVGQAFRGWSITPGAEEPTYLAGDTVTLTTGSSTLELYPVFMNYGFIYYDASRTTILLKDYADLDAPYTIRSDTSVGVTVPSGKRFIGWSNNKADTTTISVAVGDTVVLGIGNGIVYLYPVFVTPPSATQQTTRPSDAVLSTANAMVNASAETASVSGIALVQARRSNPGMRFPDHASYLRYQQGIARVQVRRAVTPRATGSVAATVPAPPTINSVSIEGYQYNQAGVVLTFTPPKNPVGAPILYYTVRAYTSVSGPDILYDIQRSQTVGDPFITIFPLSVNIPYTFQMTATNAVGTSVLSVASEEVTIPGRPDAPQNVTTDVSDTQITINFEAPPNTGGSPILYYIVETYNAADNESALPDISSTIPPIAVTDLSSGTNYYFAVYAVNANGDGARAITDPVRFGPPSGNVYTSPSTTNNLVIDASSSPFAGNIYSFSGADSYMTLPGDDSWAFGTEDFTIEWFQYQTDSNQFPRIFTVGAYGGEGISVACSIESPTFYAWINSTPNLGTDATPYKGQWVHFAIVRSGGQLSVYKDGSLFAGPEENTADISNNTTTLYFGIETPGDATTAFGGYLTNIRIVKGLAVYTGNFTVPISALTLTAAAGSNTQAIPSGFTKLLLVP